MSKFKRVDEEMQKYVQSQNGDVNEDLARLNFANYPEKKKQKKKIPVYAWASAVAAVIVVVVLAAVLPTQLLNNNSTPEEPTTYYFELESVDKTKLNSIREVRALFDNTICLPKVDGLTEICHKLSSNESLIGASVDLNIYDEMIDIVSAYILLNNIELNNLSGFNYLGNSIIWKDIEVNYSIKKDQFSGACEYKVFFISNTYKHYYTINTTEEVDIGELMDLVF